MLALPARVVLFISKLIGGDTHLTTKPTASSTQGRFRKVPISPEEKLWLKEKLRQSQYDEYMQSCREAWLFLRPGHKKSY